MSFFFNLKEISSILDNISLSTNFAHKKYTQIRESLKDHIILTNVIALKIQNWMNLDNSFNSLIHELYSSKFILPIHKEIQEKEFNDFLKFIFTFLISFHDLGKLNPKFQELKMGINNIPILFDPTLFPNSHHSIYSECFLDLLLFGYLKQNYKNKPNLYQRFYFLTLFFNTAIGLHHISLRKISEFVKKPETTLNYEKIVEIFRNQFDQMNYHINLNEFILSKSQILNQNNITSFFQNIYSNPSFFILFKMFYSLLITSDFYATYLFMNGKSENELDFQFLNPLIVNDITQNFYSSKEYNKFLKDSSFVQQILALDLNAPIKLNQIRTRVLIEASIKLKEIVSKSQGIEKKRLFFLNVPTGGGKTNISMKLIIDLLESNPEYKRIFYVFPFINIIEQNYNVLTETLLDQKTRENNEIISKIYSYSELKEDSDTEVEEEFYINNLFLNYPINAISNVNFFNTFFKAFKTSNYKLINFTNSIVIIDEIHTIPTKYWDFITKSMKLYAEKLNMTIIFMSATLPNISKFLSPENQKDFISLIESSEIYNSLPQFNRVKYQFEENFNKPISQFIEISYFKERIEIELNKRKNESEKSKILIVVNKIQNSLDLFNSFDIKWLEHMRIEKILLNSTFLYPMKKKIIEKFKIKKEDLQSNFLIISTQTIEAGVDIDCDFGFREYAPIDAIEQIAGRINREGKRDQAISTLYVFPSNSAEFIYESDKRINLQRNFPPEELKNIIQQRQFNLYYERLIEFLKTDDKISSSNANLFQCLTTLDFETVSKNFNYIDNENVSLFIPLTIRIHDFPFSIPELNYFQEMLNLSPDSVIDKQTSFQIYGVAIWKLYKMMNDQNSKKDIKSIKKFQSLLNCFVISAFNKFVKSSRLIDLLKSKKIEEINDIYYIPEPIASRCFSIEQGLDVQKLIENL